MKNIFPYSLIVICFFISCKEEKPDLFNNFIFVNNQSLSNINLSEFVDDITIVRLETGDSCVIGEVTKVQLYDDKIYVLDRLSNSIFIYNISGKIVNQLNSIGQGQGEYIQLNDFEVNEKGVYVLDISGRKINQYDFDFSYINKIKFSAIGSSFIKTDSSFCLYNEQSSLFDNYQLIQIDENGTFLSKDFLRNTRRGNSYYSASSNVFQKNANKIYFSPRHSNIIYERQSNKWIKDTKLSFKSGTFSGNKDISDNDIEKGQYIFRNNFYISDMFIIIDFFIDNNRFFSIYNKQNQQGKSGRIKNNIIPDHDRFFPRWLSNNCLIESVDAEYVLEDFYGLIKMDKSLSDLQPDDNPVLVLYNLKK